MLLKLGIRTPDCRGGACNALEKVVLHAKQWEELILISGQALKESPAGYVKLRELEHKRLLRFARKQAPDAAVKA